MNTKHLVLSEPVVNATLETLLDLAIEMQLTHLWLLPSCHFSLWNDDASLDSQRWDALIYAQKQGQWKGYISSVVGRRLQPRRTDNVRVIFLEQSNWHFPSDVTAAQFTTMLEKVERVLGVPMAGSPTSVGLRYLEKVDERYYRRYFAKSSEVDWDALKEVSVPAISWFPSVASVPPGIFVHCYDRNSSHPYAASQEKFGVGEPIIQEGGTFKHLLPGLWDVEIDSLDKFDSRLPPLLWKSYAWVPTPLLRIAQIAGCNIRVKQALIWPQHAPVFERWAKDLWKFRQASPEGSQEREAIKRIMNDTVGGTRYDDGSQDETFRPDWYAIIKGSERGVVWYKAWKLAKDTGVYPVGCYSDALYYLSPESDPDRAVPGILDHATSLGGYKHVWTLPVTPTVQAIFAAKMSPALRIGEFKKLVRGEV
jgi:hypothetical protein